jgi:hypothetical protein
VRTAGECGDEDKAIVMAKVLQKVILRLSCVLL